MRSTLRRDVPGSLPAPVDQRARVAAAPLWVAIGLLVAACAVIALMGAMAKTLGARLPAAEIAFFRFALTVPLIVAATPQAVTRLVLLPGLGWHVARGAAAGAALALAFYAYAHLRLADATALLFVEPVFIVAFAAVAHRRGLCRAQLVALVLGLAGACIILRPGDGVASQAGLMALLSAAFAACAALLTRRLAAPNAAPALLFHGALIPTLLLAPPAIWGWVPPTSGEWALLVLLAMAGTLGQWLIIQAYRRASPQTLAPVEYTQLPAALLLGHVLFDEAVTTTSLIGIALILLVPWLLRRAAGTSRNLRDEG